METDPPMTTITIPPTQPDGRPTCLDAWLRHNRVPGTIFRLGMGLYVTRGMYAFADLDYCMLAPDCSLIGEGMHATRIALLDPLIPANSTYTEVLTAGARNGVSAYCEVSKLTIDACCPATSARPARATVGLHIWSSEATCTDLRVERVWGTRATSPGEGFGILINNCGELGDHDGGHRIANCQVEADEGAYCCGIYPGLIRRNIPLHLSIVDGCIAASKGTAAQPAHAAYGVNSGVAFRHCQSIGKWDYALYSDTDSGDGVSMSDCSLAAGFVGVSFVATTYDANAKPAGMYRRGIIIRNSEIRLTGVDASRSTYVAALVLNDTTKSGPTGEPPLAQRPEFTDVRLENCTLDNVSPLKGYLGSINSPRAWRNGIVGGTLRGTWMPAVTDKMPATAWVTQVPNLIS